MEMEMKTCPLCPNHCPETELGCKRGQSYFNGEDSGEAPDAHSHGFEGHDGHGRRGGHERHGGYGRHGGHGRHGEYGRHGHGQHHGMRQDDLEM